MPNPFTSIPSTLANAFYSMQKDQAWQQQNQPQRRQADGGPGMNQMFAPSPWTPQAVQALSQQEFMNKRMKANSPADDWKQGMWQHVPGKGFGGGPEESFSWDQPAFHLSPEAMQWHLQRSQQANPMPMTVPSAPLPSVNAFNPNGSYNPNAPVMGRSPFSGGAWPQATQPLTGYSGGQAPSFAQMFPMTLPQESYPFGSF